jgi:hypothetical protein
MEEKRTCAKNDARNILNHGHVSSGPCHAQRMAPSVSARDTAADAQRVNRQYW